MSRITTINNTVSVVPTGYSNNTFTSSYYQNLDNGLSGSDSNTYAQFTMRSTNYYIYYDFSVSGIPSNATITSITCQVKGYVGNASYYPSVQLYSNTTAKGSASNITSTSSSNVINLSVGSWTLSELQSARLYIKCAASTTRNSRYFYFYGATLTVTYEYNGLVYEVNTTSNSTNSSFISYDSEIMPGNDSIISMSISNINDVIVLDNGNNITSSLINTSGTTYIYTINNVQEDHEIIINDKISHNITSTLNTTLVESMSPSGQNTIYEGESYTLTLEVDSIDLIEVLDNDIDVTGSLVRENNITITNDSQSTVLGEYTLVSGSFNGSGATWFSGRPGNGVDTSSTTTSNYYSSGSGSIAVFNYKLEFNNIPSNATITRLYVEVNGHAESTDNTNEYMCAQLRSGDTELSDELNFKSIGTSNSTQTIEATTLPTVSQLADLVLYCRLGYYGGAINGATCYIEYTVPVHRGLTGNTQYVWIYTLQNVTADHTINVNELVSVTTHTINIINNNTEVIVLQSSIIIREGNNTTIELTSSRGEGIILLDNGIDVTSSLTNNSDSYYYTISNILNDHTLTINEKYWYEITTENMYSNAIVNVSHNKVYEGYSFDVTINVSNISLIDVKDNGNDLSLNSSGNGVYTITITNVQEDHEIIVLEANSYSITSMSNTSNAQINPSGINSALEDSSMTFTITTDLSSDLLILKDNATDVTSSLTYISATTPTSDTSTFIPSSFDSTNSSYASIYEGTTEDGLSSHTDTSRICVYSNTGAGVESDLYYNFDCSSIPLNATNITVSCIATASVYQASTYFSTYDLQLCNGITEMGSATTITGSGSTSATHNINGGSWTRNELNNIKIRVRVIRGTSSTTSQASFSFWGATLTVNYEVDGDGYYQYTLSNINEDHVVALYEVFIPEEEDETKTYHSITISSINATTNPNNGTIRVEEGTNQIIEISLNEPKITVVTDNGVDITNDLVMAGDAPSYTVTEQASGATYGFELNNSTEYYVSNNAGQSSSAAVCRVNFNLPGKTLITIEYINYAEATYDYGIFGNIDTALSTSSTADSDAYKVLSSSADNSDSPQTLTYEIEAGEHFIDIKFIKDGSQDSNNDNLQWKILSMQVLESNAYTYTLSNITDDHNLIFIFGEVVYYTTTSSGTGCKLYPTGNFVTLPEENYSLTIIPDKTTYNVILYDNGRDVSSKLEYLNSNGSVSYVYSIKKVTTNHTIIVTCEPSQIIYQKISNVYIAFSKVYKKISGSWVEQDDYRSLFENNKIYINKGSLN